MIRHLFKLAWNRRRTTALVAAEIFVSFLVVFVTAAAAIYSWDNYHRPLGFSWDRVWDVRIDTKRATDDDWTPAMTKTYSQLFLALKDLPEIESFGGAFVPPYYQGRSQRASKWGAREVEYEVDEFTDGVKDTLGMQVVRGRWFDATDDGQVQVPILINEKMARETFGSDDPIGRKLPWEDSPHRIVGVFTDFRRGGELSPAGWYAIERIHFDDANRRPPRHILVRVRPGTGVGFEESLTKTLGSVARDWSFEVTPLEQSRATMLRLQFLPVAAASIIAVFMMLMVALGLLGVLWQNVSQRTSEIGLRRAKGASARHIYAQIVGEVLVLTTVAAGAAAILCAQVPLLGVAGFVGAPVLAAAMALSLVVIYLLTAACSLYPAWLAARVVPAQALHYD